MYSVKIVIKQTHKTVPSTVLLKLKNKINHIYFFYKNIY